ncbi:hypothetical protein [Paractinoplanes toevensis]|nr:hypothetical protein [Actinoplanes toevensis]
MIATPAAGNRVEPAVDWIADNSAFTGRYPGDTAYLQWLCRRREHRGRCAFATAPDVVADSAATLSRSLPMLSRIRAAGYRAALVAQDGMTAAAIHFPEIDVLFLGGTTGWKLGAAAADLVAAAHAHGVRTHMGRVNSLRRLRYADSIGCHSVDGTYLTYGPSRNLPHLPDWLQTVARETVTPGDWHSNH